MQTINHSILSKNSMISNKEVKQDRDYDIRKCINMMKDESNITEQKFKEFTAQLDILQSELSESIVARNKDYNQTVKELEQIDRRFEIFSDYKNIRSAVESMQKEIASKQTLDDTTNMVSERSSKTKPKTRFRGRNKSDIRNRTLDHSMHLKDQKHQNFPRNKIVKEVKFVGSAVFRIATKI